MENPEYQNNESLTCILGKTLTTALAFDNIVALETSDGDNYWLMHEQDCCEEVVLQDVCGDLDDLIGKPILSAESRTSSDSDDGLWTFYHLATCKGRVDLRWVGTSEGGLTLLM